MYIELNIVSKIKIKLIWDIDVENIPIECLQGSSIP